MPEDITSDGISSATSESDAKVYPVNSKVSAEMRFKREKARALRENITEESNAENIFDAERWETSLHEKGVKLALARAAMSKISEGDQTATHELGYIKTPDGRLRAAGVVRWDVKKEPVGQLPEPQSMSYALRIVLEGVKEEVAVYYPTETEEEELEDFQKTKRKKTVWKKLDNTWLPPSMDLNKSIEVAMTKVKVKTLDDSQILPMPSTNI